ncbi:leucine-rich repeat protein, partial [Pseudoflavonifractor sp. 60]|uniref:leucine-rich repeat protein n=1 Tax=Pseudoflavonifractor sp. 60 TaxID=2304576 RepID=UPI001370BCE1
MNDVGVMRAHMHLVEIDTPVTELEESELGSYLGPKQAAPLLEANGVDLDYYDHVSCFISLNVSTEYGAITNTSGFENDTGHSCHNLRNIEFAQYDHKPSFPGTACVHEFLHFLEQMSKKWGEEFDFHAIGDKLYTEGEYIWRECYTDIILNQVNSDAGLGTGVAPAVWQYSPHVLRTMTELNVPSSVTSVGNFQHYTGLTSVTFSSGNASIEDRAFWGLNALTRVTIPASMTNIGYASFWDTGVTDVYYAGTEEQWKAIQIGEYNETLTRANIHY